MEEKKQNVAVEVVKALAMSMGMLAAGGFLAMVLLDIAAKMPREKTIFGKLGERSDD